MKYILAASPQAARNFCRDMGYSPNEVVIIQKPDTLLGRRFRYEDVIRVRGWSQHPYVEAIEERILDACHDAA